MKEVKCNFCPTTKYSISDNFKNLRKAPKYSQNINNQNKDIFPPTAAQTTKIQWKRQKQIILKLFFSNIFSEVYCMNPKGTTN